MTKEKRTLRELHDEAIEKIMGNHMLMAEDLDDHATYVELVKQTNQAIDEAFVKSAKDEGYTEQDIKEFKALKEKNLKQLREAAKSGDFAAAQEAIHNLMDMDPALAEKLVDFATNGAAIVLETKEKGLPSQGNKPSPKPKLN